MSTERQIHDAFSAYLRKERLCSIHHRMDKKSGIQTGWPDFTICHVGRCLMVEVKTGKGKLTPVQEKVIAVLQERGNRVEIVRSVEQAIWAVQTWLGVETVASANPEPPTVPFDNERAAEVIAGVTEHDLFIMDLGGQFAVYSGDPAPGGTIQRVRRATPDDLARLPRR